MKGEIKLLNNMVAPKNYYSYLLIVKNNFSVQINNVLLDQVAPSGSTFVKATDMSTGQVISPLTVVNDEITWGMGGVSSGQEKMIKLDYQAEDGLPCYGKIIVPHFTLTYSAAGKSYSAISNSSEVLYVCGPAPTPTNTPAVRPTPTATLTPIPTPPPEYGLTFDLRGDYSVCPGGNYYVQLFITNTGGVNKTFGIEWYKPSHSSFIGISFSSLPTLPVPTVGASNFYLIGNLPIAAGKTVRIDFGFSANSNLQSGTVEVGPFKVTMGGLYQNTAKHGIAVKGASVCAPASCTYKAFGDADCDGKVNRADLAQWINQSVSGTPVAAASADFDGNGMVNRADLARWINGFADPTVPH